MRNHGEDWEQFTAVVEASSFRQPLAPGRTDHALKGHWEG
jgi:mRNA-degrading endonuclease YafQ of YafQ-DinJ toxin-antitoxin module